MCFDSVCDSIAIGYYWRWRCLLQLFFLAIAQRDRCASMFKIGRIIIAVGLRLR